ncbi:MAG: hypothetical protein RLN87_06535 [Parasphingopyxis sp.]|uniref:hypothetical protein n=1 Tax=Parasphingopyxis sp. TaxID=1920299 RepID=UPI0032EDC7D5
MHKAATTRLQVALAVGTMAATCSWLALPADSGEPARIGSPAAVSENPPRASARARIVQGGCLTPVDRPGGCGLRRG